MGRKRTAILLLEEVANVFIVPKVIPQADPGGLDEAESKESLFSFCLLTSLARECTET